MNHKKTFLAVYLTILFVFVFIPQIYAQSPKIISAGIINGKAISLPQPTYSDKFSEAGTPGTINVKVLIDENGKVISAETISGLENSTLRKACEAAALKATFSPTTLSGQPVKVSGVIVYRFVDGRNNEAKLKILAVSTLLGILRVGASNTEIFYEFFSENELLNTKTPELADFADEIAPLTNLENISPPERIEAINQSSLLIVKKLNESEKWQFELGKHLGGLMGTFFQFRLTSGEIPDISKLDKEAVKEHTTGIKNLLASAPSDFPADVKEKLVNIATTGENKTYETPEDLLELTENITALLETISPGSTD